MACWLNSPSFLAVLKQCCWGHAPLHALWVLHTWLLFSEQVCAQRSKSYSNQSLTRTLYDTSLDFMSMQWPRLLCVYQETVAAVNITAANRRGTS